MINTKRKAKKDLIGWVYISPWIIGFLLLTVIPLIVSLIMSFSNWDMFSSPKFIGFENYKKLLSFHQIEGKTFYAALSNTFLYTIFTALINIIFGLIVAWSLFRTSKMNTVIRTIIYLPCMVIGIAVSLMMGPIFGSSDFALVNQIRHAFGQNPQEWLFTKGQGVWVMILMSFWGIGGAMIIFIAGIKNIDNSIYEAAMIEGASNLQIFTRICIPLIKPMIIYQLIMSLVFGMQVFDIPVGLASIGGAGSSFGMGIDNSLATLVFYLYNTGFKDFQMGMACAIGWLIFIITSIIGAILFAVLYKNDYFGVNKNVQKKR